MPSKVGIWHNGRQYSYVPRDQCTCPKEAQYNCSTCRYFTEAERRVQKKRIWRLHAMDCLFCERTVIETKGWKNSHMYAVAKFTPDDMKLAIEIAKQRHEFILDAAESSLIPAKPDVVDAAIALMIERYLGHERKTDELFFPNAMKAFEHTVKGETIRYRICGRTIKRHKHLFTYSDGAATPSSYQDTDIVILGGVYPGQTDEVYLSGYIPQWAWAGYATYEGPKEWGEGMQVYRGPMLPLMDVLEGHTKGYSLDEPALPTKKPRASRRKAKVKGDSPTQGRVRKASVEKTSSRKT